MSVATNWGTTREERELTFPGDYLVQRPHAELFRGVTVRAEPAVVFRWVCQLQVSSYSYTGRNGPRELTPGLDELSVGARFMDVFGLVDFTRDWHVTLRLEFDTTEGRLYGRVLEELVATYLIVPGEDACRLLLKYVVRYRGGPLGLLARLGLPWIDVFLARKQLLTLRHLAEGRR
jgi:hypothetical protein